MKKFSKSKKLNALYNAIYESIEEVAQDCTDDGINQDAIDSIGEFTPGNYWENGNIGWIYTSDLKNLFLDCGYKCENWSNDKLHDAMKRCTNYVCYLYRKEVKGY